MTKLPKDPSKPFTVNGIKFASRDEYERRIKADAEGLAKLIYRIYLEHERRV